jgi:hypothetical protein
MRRLLLIGAGIVFASCGSGSTTSPSFPAVLLTTAYTLACQWTPSTPTVARAVFDVQVPGDDTRPASNSAVMALTSAGARIDYLFHGPDIRAEIDVTTLTRLWQSQVVTFAASVSDLSNHDVIVFVTYSRPVTTDDQQSLVALGTTIRRVLSHALNGVELSIDDAKAPAIASLPGVTLVEYDTSFCAGTEARRLAVLTVGAPRSMFDR